MLRWLKILAPALALAALIFEVGCTSNDLAQVRFVHAIQDANALDIDINGTKEFQDVGFTNYLPASGYMGVPTGTVTVEGFSSGTTTEVFSESGVKLSAASQYTMVATGFDTSTSSVIILAPVDNNTTPANGTINFRVIDASPSGPTAADIYILQSQVQGLTPPATIAGLSYQQTSKYIPEPFNSNGGGYTIYVCAAGTTIPLFFQNIPVGSSNAGSIRTLILTDQPNKDELNPQFIVLHDLN